MSGTKYGMGGARDLNDMMLFIAVIDAGSFTLAADRLNLETSVAPRGHKGAKKMRKILSCIGDFQNSCSPYWA